MRVFSFVSLVQYIVHGLAFVDGKVPLIPANYLCGISTYLLDSLWAPGQSMAQLHTACPQGRRPPAASPLRSPAGPARLAALSPQPGSGVGSCTVALSLFHRFCVCVKTQVIHQFWICLKTQMIQITRKVNSGIELRKRLLLVRLGLLFNFQLNFQHCY